MAPSSIQLGVLSEASTTAAAAVDEEHDGPALRRVGARWAVIFSKKLQVGCPRPRLGRSFEGAGFSHADADRLQPGRWGRFQA